MAVELVETAVGAALPRAVERCRAAGVDATLVAGVLGVSRATLYRKFLVARESVVAAEPVDAEGLGA